MGGSRTAPTNDGHAAPSTKRKPLGRLIGAFKTVSTQRVNGVLGTPGVTLWQRHDDERIVRNDEELARARRYIADNPVNWPRDAEYANSPAARLRQHGS